MAVGCGQCGKVLPLCDNCHNCAVDCRCPAWWDPDASDLFDADELGLDPETDNTPQTESRHA